MEVETPHGLARAHVTRGDGRGTLVLGQGAGGSVEAPDLRAVARRRRRSAGRSCWSSSPIPLEAPRRTGPPASRLAELDSVSVPSLVVQGARDRFGVPPAAPRRTVVEVPGDHALKADLPAVTYAVRSWLERLTAWLRSGLEG